MENRHKLLVPLVDHLHLNTLPGFRGLPGPTVEALFPTSLAARVEAGTLRLLPMRQKVQAADPDSTSRNHTVGPEITAAPRENEVHSAERTTRMWRNTLNQ